MADINVERKGPSIWPWIVGLLVLALLIWAIAEMVDRDRATDEVVVEEVEQEVPAPAMPAPTPTPGAGGVRELSEVLPLDAQDEGQQVRLSGRVLGQPAAGGYWVMTSDGQGIFVQSQQQVQSGQQVQVTGTLRQSQPEQMTRWFDSARLNQDQNYGQIRELHRNMYVSEGGTAGTQQQQQQQTPPSN